MKNFRKTLPLMAVSFMVLTFFGSCEKAHERHEHNKEQKEQNEQLDQIEDES